MINLLTMVRHSSFTLMTQGTFYLARQSVTSTQTTLRKRVEAVLEMALTTVSSLDESFTSGTPALPTDESTAMLDIEKEKSASTEIAQQGTDANGAQKNAMDVDKPEQAPSAERDTQEPPKEGVKADGEGHDSGGSSEDEDAMLEVHD